MAEASESLTLDSFALVPFLATRLPSTVGGSQLVLTFAVLLGISILHLHYSNPLSKLPSAHWSAPWSRCFILWQIYKDKRRQAHYGGHFKELGQILPVIRVAPNEVSIITFAGIDAVYKAGFDRSSHYKVFQNYGGTPNMFSFEPRAEHSKRKRLVAAPYSKSSICAPRAQRIINNNVQEMIEFVGRHIDASSSDDSVSLPLIPRNIFRALAVDIITAFAISESSCTNFLDRLRSGPNTMEDIGMDDFTLWNQDERDEYFFFESQPGFKNMLSFFAPQAQPAHDKMEAYVARLLARHEEETSRTGVPTAIDRKQILLGETSPYDRLLQAKDPATGETLGWRKRASEILDHIGAGYDPVAYTLEYILEQLTLHPTLRSHLRSELRTYLAQPSTSPTPSEEDPATTTTRTWHYKNLSTLPYLDAIVLESLRTISTIETYQPRVVSTGGCTIEGYFLPPGTIVSCQPYLINNHPEIFEDPFAFKPERWLGLQGEAHRELRAKLWTFSSGPRACVGRELALAIIKTTLAHLFFNFDVRTLPKEQKTWTHGHEAKKVECVIAR